ncbi:MAG: hypothetical protein GY856_54810 [bacterium]|nr:hypothetical protein [bacterium]
MPASEGTRRPGVAGPGANAVAVFSRDSGTGELSFVEAEIDASLNGAAALVVTPDGRRPPLRRGGRHLERRGGAEPRRRSGERDLRGAHPRVLRPAFRAGRQGPSLYLWR